MKQKNSFFTIIKCFFVIYCLFLGLNNFAQASGDLLTDNFASDADQWTPVSGAWIPEDGTYKQKETGVNYISATDTAVFSDDFTNEAPATLATPFTEPFTQADGAAANWTVKRGSFAVSSNTYRAPNGGGYTLSIPTDTSYNSWTDYRVTASYQRMGASDASGYSIFYFRSTVTGSTDNSYVLAIRQTGVANFYKKADTAFTLLGSFTVSKDNDWHTLTAEIVGSTFKAWIDKDYTTNAPDFSVSGLTDYTSGTIGIGTTGWVSYFDDVTVTTLTSGYQFTEKRCAFWANSGTYYAIPGSCDGARALAVISDTDSLLWKNYRITAQVKNLGALVSTNYSIINFRTTLSGNNDNSYALLLRQDGTADVYEVVNNWSSSALLGTFATDSDTDYHDVVIEIAGTSLKIWYDRTASTQAPNFQYNHLSTYTAGTVGLGAMGGQGVFNNVVVDPIVAVQPQPSFLYAGEDNTSNLVINSTDTTGDLTFTVTNPSGTSWTLTNPAACSGLVDCQVVFPTDFSGADISETGTYAVTAQRGDNISYSLLEVREAPLFTFVQASDIHYDSTSSNAAEELNRLNSFIDDINNQKYFPTPSFMVATGDITDHGTTTELSAVKSEFDNLDIAYYPIVGNHDTSDEVGDAMGTNWQTTFGADKFSYNWTLGNFLFLAMDVESPYGGYGSDLGSSAHQTWLQSILDANPTKKVLLFSHFSLNEPRDGGAAQGFWNEDSSNLVRAILENHGGVVAEIAGHDHINSLTSVNGIAYITTASFYSNDQYRYVEIYSDHIVSKIIRADSYSYTQDGQLWSGSTDSTHTASDYSFGLPHEREMEINFSGSEVVEPVEAITIAGNEAWQHYDFSADVTVRNNEIVGQNVAGLIFRYTDTDNYYSVVLDSAADTLTLRKRVDGVVTDLASNAATITPDTTYEIDVSAVGPVLNIYLDDVLEISTTDSTFTAGKIGLSSYTALNEFDNVVVTALALPTVSWTTSSQSANEGAGTITVTAQLSTTFGANVTVPFTMDAASTATGSGTDYSITSSPLTITAGSTTASATITIVEDSSDEANETVIVNMGSPTNATQGATTVHTATITDNDDAPTVTSVTGIELTDGSGDVTISFIADDSADDDTLQALVEYNIGAGWVKATISETLSDITATYGTPDVENDNAYQIGNGGGYITTSSGANTITAVWESKTDVPTADLSTAQIRVTPYDGTEAGTAVSSSNFIVDNVVPSGLSGLNLNATNATEFTAWWTPVSTESNFSHYELWVGTTASGVLARDETATEYDSTDIANLATMTTSSATFLEDCTGQCTYYVSVWAQDDYGNETSPISSSITVLKLSSTEEQTVTVSVGGGSGLNGVNAGSQGTQVQDTGNETPENTIENDSTVPADIPLSTENIEISGGAPGTQSLNEILENLGTILPQDFAWGEEALNNFGAMDLVQTIYRSSDPLQLLISNFFFQPFGNLSRMEVLQLSMIAFMQNTLMEKVQTTGSVSDISMFLDANDTASQDNTFYLTIGFNHGVISGYPDKTFRPTQKATRAEALKMLLLSSGVRIVIDSSQGLLSQFSLEQNPFSDMSLNEWYAPYVLYAYNKGIIHGYGDGTFRGDQAISRVEFSKILTTLYDQTKNTHMAKRGPSVLRDLFY